MSRYNKKISIIIPTIRMQSVLKTVESVIAQADNYDYEIIIVGKNANAVGSIFTNCNVVFIDTGTQHPPSQTRNIGASRAKGEILLFIDDDCEAAQGWLKNNLKFLTDPLVGIVTGKVVGKSGRFFAKCVDLNFYLQQGERERTLERFSSITFGIRRAVFNELKGFDESIIVREDIDLARRVVAAGYKILYSPDIAVIHDHKRDSFAKLLRYQYKLGLLSGLSVPFKHRRGWKDYIKVSFKDFYFLLVLPVAIWSTAKQIAGIFKLERNLLLFLPFIFISNLSYQLGVLRWLRLRAE